MIPDTKIPCSKSNPQLESVLENIDTANKEETGIYACHTMMNKIITITQSESCNDVGLYFHQHVFYGKLTVLPTLKENLSNECSHNKKHWAIRYKFPFSFVKFIKDSLTF